MDETNDSDLRAHGRARLSIPQRGLAFRCSASSGSTSTQPMRCWSSALRTRAVAALSFAYVEMSSTGPQIEATEGNGPIGFYHFVAETLNRHVPFLRALRDHLQENDHGRGGEARM